MLERIADEGFWWVGTGGWVICEIGNGQKEHVEALFAAFDREVRKDLSGRDRILVARRGRVVVCDRDRLSERASRQGAMGDEQWAITRRTIHSRCFPVRNLLRIGSQMRQAGCAHCLLPIAPMTIDLALEALMAGRVIGIPTDTVYGIGVDPMREDALRRLYEIKGRPEDSPIPILAASLADARGLGMIDDAVGKYWPGPLTVVVRRMPETPRWIGDAAATPLRCGFLIIRLPSLCLPGPVPWR